jgi:hypothetical protein
MQYQRERASDITHPGNTYGYIVLPVIVKEQRLCYTLALIITATHSNWVHLCITGHIYMEVYHIVCMQCQFAQLQRCCMSKESCIAI